MSAILLASVLETNTRASGVRQREQLLTADLVKALHLRTAANVVSVQGKYNKLTRTGQTSQLYLRVFVRWYISKLSSLGGLAVNVLLVLVGAESPVFVFAVVTCIQTQRTSARQEHPVNLALGRMRVLLDNVSSVNVGIHP